MPTFKPVLYRARASGAKMKRKTMASEKPKLRAPSDRKTQRKNFPTLRRDTIHGGSGLNSCIFFLVVRDIRYFFRVPSLIAVNSWSRRLEVPRETPGICSTFRNINDFCSILDQRADRSLRAQGYPTQPQLFTVRYSCSIEAIPNRRGEKRCTYLSPPERWAFGDLGPFSSGSRIRAVYPTQINFNLGGLTLTLPRNTKDSENITRKNRMFPTCRSNVMAITQ